MHLSKLLIVVSCVLVLAGWPRFVEAKELVWDRNTESDMADYDVYGCDTANCVVLKTQSNYRGRVVQPAVGVIPKFTIPLTLTEGSLAVTARDQSGNESGLSVQVPFDFRPPAIPVGPRLQ